jgi:hypothetical protein
MQAKIKIQKNERDKKKQESLLTTPLLCSIIIDIKMRRMAQKKKRGKYREF